MAEIILKDKKLNNLIRQTVIATIQEILRDPDFGLELQEWVEKRLKKHPSKLISFKEIKKSCQ